MKTFLFLAVFISGTTLAQTNVIAAKSHASSKVIDKNDTDNFGEPGPMRFIQTVTYLKDDCIVEKYRVEWDNHDTEYDTVCDHPFLQENAIDIDRIKAMYPPKTKFIDFNKVGKKDQNIKQDTERIGQEGENIQKSKRELRKERRSKKSGGLLIFFIGGGLFFIYLFVPKMRANNS